MRNRITDEELDAALAESFPASDPLPMSPGADLAMKLSRKRKVTRAPVKGMVDTNTSDNRTK